jgi:prepilin-type N-terminal cleavage/methylation domain-containing protein/prepilin-type processing-associated H-X9-DG protein
MSMRKGFTLIELLVVIAIIALLMGVLMPALNKVKESAKKVKCQAQQRQYGLAINMYAHDNSESLPFFCKTFLVSDSLDPNRLWYSVVARYMDIKGAVGSGGNVQAAGANSDIRRCPAGKRDTTGFYGNELKSWIGWIGVNYGGYNIGGDAPAPIVYETDGTGSIKSDPVKLTSIRKPDDWIMLLDVIYYWVYTPASTKFTKDMDGDGKLDSADCHGWFYNGANPKIHNNGCNITLCDGHTEWIDFKTLWALKNDGTMVHSYWYNEK